MTIKAQILNFIENPDPTYFEKLALAVFEDQFARVQPYRRFVLSCGMPPEKVRTVAEIPPVSTAAFKYVEFCSATPRRVFMTSGTTLGREERGRHLIADIELYRASALKHMQRMLFPDGCRPWMLALHPTADRMPESSLSQMISWCIEVFGGGEGLCCATRQGVDLQAALSFLHEAENRGAPLCILSTTAAISSLFQYLRVKGARLQLAAGSRLMDTGGAKGQSHPLAPGDIFEMASRYLAIPPPWVINEYGMTELCSQLYDATSLNSYLSSPDDGLERVKVAPPWLKVIARDPKTLAPLGPGELGLLSFFDLANAGSVSALLTEDIGMVNADGTVRLFGRYLSADPRGCALAIEQFAARLPASLPAQGLVQENRGKGRRLGYDAPARWRIPAETGQELAHCLTGEGASELGEIASRLRSAVAAPLSPQHIAAVLARACERWRDPSFAQRVATVAAASANGPTLALLNASLDALLAGFTAGALGDLARRLSTRERLIGFIMPGNVIGAGLHEVVQALIAGAAVIVKASSLEPRFFAQFCRTVQSIDPALASRMCVVVWGRSDYPSTAAMAAACDRIVAFGEDRTITAMAAIAGPKLIGFGSRISGAVLASEAIAGASARSTAAALARDVSFFDQRGCLSLHHIMIEGTPASGRDFGQMLALELEAASLAMPPDPNPPMDESAAARALRESTRWRAIGGAPVALWEGKDLSCTVIFDPHAGFQPAPLRRSVRISVFESREELARRLNSATAVLEGCVIADPAGRLEAARKILRQAGVSYFCEPGQLQSPPPSWPHGGGRFLRLMETGDG